MQISELSFFLKATAFTINSIILFTGNIEILSATSTMDKRQKFDCSYLYAV